MERILSQGGLKLTPRGFLKRADVRLLFDQTEWPGIEREDVLEFHKVVSEENASGVFFTRIVLQIAGVLRKRLGVLNVVKIRSALLAPEAAPELLALLLEATFWKTNLQDFDMVPLEFWPQHHMGVVLWSLSVTAHDWTSSDALMQACTLMETVGETYLASDPESAFILRVLRPLAWLGLMEMKQKDGEPRRRWFLGTQLYRKTPLFDQLLSFKVEMAHGDAAKH